MSISREYARKVRALFLWLTIAVCTVSSCAVTGLRIVTPSNAPPDISYRMVTDTPAHRGISIGGSRFLGHEIIAAADGVVVSTNDDELGGHRSFRILHGQNSSQQNIYTDHYHVLGQLLKKGDRVTRGQILGYIGYGGHGGRNLPHYHFIVIAEESPKTFIAVNPRDFWFGIDQYKEKLEKGIDIGSFTISCFDPSVDYPKEPIRFTYPVKCN